MFVAGVVCNYLARKIIGLDAPSFVPGTRICSMRHQSVEKRFISGQTGIVMYQVPGKTECVPHFSQYRRGHIHIFSPKSQSQILHFHILNWPRRPYNPSCLFFILKKKSNALTGSCTAVLIVYLAQMKKKSYGVSERGDFAAERSALYTLYTLLCGLASMTTALRSHCFASRSLLRLWNPLEP